MSPWAKLMTRITPKMRESPTAMRLYTPPKSRPFTTDWASRVGFMRAKQRGRGARRPPGGRAHTETPRLWLRALPELWGGEDQLALRHLIRMDHQRLALEDLDHGAGGVGVVPHLVEPHRAAGDHDRVREIGLLDGVHDGIGVGGLGPLQHVGQHYDGVVGVARVRVQGLAAGPGGGGRAGPG